MTRYIYPLLLAVLLLTFSCGGGSVKKDPAPSHPAMKHLQKGIGWYQRGCFGRSLEAFTKAHELFTASDQLPGVAMSLNNMGNVYRYVGDSQSALLFFQEAHDIYSQLHNTNGVIQALSNLTAIYIQEDRLDEAAAAIKTAEDMTGAAEKIPAHVLNNKGVLYTRQHRYNEAETALTQALETVNPENTHVYATIYSSLGNLMLEMSNEDKGLVYYEKALSIDRKSEFYPGLADNLNTMGKTYFQQGNYDRAMASFQRSIKIYALFGKKDQVTRIMKNLEDIATHTGTDLTLTRHFVDKWLKGEHLEHPCQ